MTNMILATADTANFTFQTLAASRAEAEKQLLAAWRAHRSDYKHAHRDFMKQMIADGDINFAEISLGQTLRDGEAL